MQFSHCQRSKQFNIICYVVSNFTDTSDKETDDTAFILFKTNLSLFRVNTACSAEQKECQRVGLNFSCANGQFNGSGN
jgi:hypothetical protein